MQLAKRILLIGALSGAIAGAQPPVPPPQPSAYEEARGLYVEAALVQVQAYRKNLDAAMKSAPDQGAQWAEAKRLLKTLEALISRLRSAAPSEFDAVKATFERTRMELDRALAGGAG